MAVCKLGTRRLMGEALQAELIQTQVGGPLENAAEFNKKKISPQFI